MNRRGFIIGLSSLVAAPAIVRAASLMPVSAMAWRSTDEIVADLLARLAETEMAPRWSHVDSPVIVNPGYPGFINVRETIRRIVVATPVPAGMAMRPSPPRQADSGYWGPDYA